VKVDDAILAHARWKTRLISYLNQPDGSINVGELGADDRCELGKWIHGEASRVISRGDLAPLQTAHAKFHRAAADVVRKVDGGTAANSDSLIGLHSEFGAASLSVIQILKSLASKIV
jgi:hypothetical protein